MEKRSNSSKDFNAKSIKVLHYHTFNVQFLTSSGTIRTIELETWRIKCRTYDHSSFRLVTRTLKDVANGNVRTSGRGVSEVSVLRYRSVPGRACEYVESTNRYACSTARARLPEVEERSKQLFEIGNGRNSSNLGEAQAGRGRGGVCTPWT